MLVVEDTGLVAADSLDTAEEDEHSLVGAGCNSLAEGNAAVRSKSSELSTRTAGTPAASQALSLANDSGSTGNKHNNSKPRWK